MKVFSVYGCTQSGKTTTIEQIIKELRNRRYSVGSVKEIHNEQFKIDQEGTNTHRHKVAGSQLVTARGLFETDVLYQRMISLPEILKHYEHDYVVCEGVTDYNLPKILTGNSMEELESRWSKGIFAISGRVADIMNEYRGLPVINALDDCEKLVDLIEEKVFHLLPDVDEVCCSACGTNCRDFCDGLLKGIYKPEECVQQHKKVQVYVDDKPLDMVPFVQNIIKASVKGMISQLDGYNAQSTIRIEINSD